jgi:meso-butanediol dehydrogenase/(S,S)-butanediol dehydrogenase/diacetyl reductase
MDQLAGKVAVVTGSAGGLGRAIAERFAQEGMTVVIADNRLTEAESVAEEIERDGGRAIAVEVDVSKRESVIALADLVAAKLGDLSVLVNNAGVVSFSPVTKPEERGWRWIVDVNLFGVVHGLQILHLHAPRGPPRCRTPFLPNTRWLRRRKRLYRMSRAG